MENVPEVLSKYFWIALMAVTVVNGLMFKLRYRKHIQNDPQLSADFSKLIRGFIIWWNLPWVVMGAGILLGQLPTMWHCFSGVRDNPFALAWWVSILIAVLVSMYWAFSGAPDRICARLKEMRLLAPFSPIAIKLFLVGALIMTVVLFARAYTGKIRMPDSVDRPHSSAKP
jgi:hypothetical protein